MSLKIQTLHLLSFFILKKVKVVCFDGVLQVFILKLVRKSSLEEDDGTLVRSFLVLRRRMQVSRGVEDWPKMKNAP
jgi:hypothetical protein